MQTYISSARMDSAAYVTSNDGPAVRNSTTLCGGVARKRYDRGAGLQLPHLERPVIGGGHRAPAVRGHGHGPDPVGVASEGVQLAAGLQLPHLECVVPRGGHRAPAESVDAVFRFLAREPRVKISGDALMRFTRCPLEPQRGTVRRSTGDSCLKTSTSQARKIPRKTATDNRRAQTLPAERME
jgi:hypothetical protein